MVDAFDAGAAVDAGDGAVPEAACPTSPRPTPPAELRFWLTGNAEDACVSLESAVMVLMGGGNEVDQAFAQVRLQVGRADVVVLRTDARSTYNDYLAELLAADSVETLVIDSRDAASSAYVEWVLASAEMVWIAGGDQSRYLELWQDTAVSRELAALHARGGVIGGTSAGLAVLSEVVYDPGEADSATSAEAAADPCHRNVALSKGFAGLSAMRGVVADSHFRERDRLGRLLVFMAKAAEMVEPRGVTGIGVDEDTAVIVEASGRARVFGAGAAYVLRADAQSALGSLRCGQPVDYRGVVRYRLRDGDVLELATGEGSVSATRVGLADGRYAPSDPY